MATSLPLSPVAFFALVCLFLLSCSSSSSVEAFRRITFLSPTPLVRDFSGSALESSPALFGVAPWGSSITGAMVYPDYNQNACVPFAATILSWPAGKDPTVIMLIDREEHPASPNCTFVRKLKNAQDAGASAVFFVNFNDTLPYMGDDGSELSKSLRIPCLMVRQSDGIKLKKYAHDKNQLGIVQITWGVSAQDKVTAELLTSVTDLTASELKASFAGAVSVLGSNIAFTPHYALGQHDESMDDDFCSNQDRYCPVGSPPHDGITGLMLLAETLRQICVFRVSTSSAAAVAKPEQWWQYVKHFNRDCFQSFSESCSLLVMDTLKIDVAAINQCVTESGGLTAERNTLFEAEQAFGLSTLRQQGLLRVPTLLVNGELYTGGFSCPSLSLSTCSPLKGVCAGFSISSAPIACAPSDCVFGQVKDSCGTCGGSNACVTTPSNPSSGPGGISWTVLIVLLIIVIAFGVIAFWLYTKRQRQLAQVEIDEILAQYAPMAEQQQQGATNGAMTTTTRSSGPAAAAYYTRNLEEPPLSDDVTNSLAGSTDREERSQLQAIGSALAQSLRGNKKPTAYSEVREEDAPMIPTSNSQNFTIGDDEDEQL